MKTYLLYLMCFMFLPSILMSQNKEKSVLVNVYDAERNPFSGVAILNKNSKEKYKTDKEGFIEVKAASNDTLIFTYKKYLPSEILVSDNTAIAIFMKPIPIVEKKEIVGALGIPKSKETITYAYSEVSSEDLLIGRNNNTTEALASKVSGLNVHTPMYKPKIGRQPKEIYLRGRRSLKGGNAALVVIDGVVSNYEILESLDNNIIESITVNKSANGAALYGSAAANGVIMVKTRKNFSLPSQGAQQNIQEKYYKGRPKVKLQHDTPNYIHEFKAAENKSDAFNWLRANKDKYTAHSSYFLDAYDYFKEDDAYRTEILNIIKSPEIDNENLLRGFAYTLEIADQNEDAELVYNKIMTLQPKNAIAYRDLALIYNEKGEHQAAFNILNTLLDDDLMEEAALYNSKLLKPTILNDVNGLLQKKINLNTNELHSYNKINTTYDLRIVIEYNRGDVSLNLKVVDPFSEISSKENTVTGIGGELNVLYGFTEYTLRHKRDGNYYILADYMNHSADSAVYLKVTVYKNFGTDKESKETKLIRLTESGNNKAIHKIEL